MKLTDITEASDLPFGGMKKFPDGDGIVYWRDKENPKKIWGQPVDKKRNPKGRKFVYHGDQTK